MKARLFSFINTALVVNLFFVLLSFGWFAVAVLGRSTQVNLGLDLWYSLWMPVFQPAIGILMAGAILSGVASWVSRKLAPKDAEG